MDQWWGPAPWRAETKSMDFSVGGFWLYAMVGPENEKHWARMNYLAIDIHESFDVEDIFCDEDGNLNTAMPAAKGKNVFKKTATGTMVEFKVYYPSETAMQAIVDMGFEQGITICMEQLNSLLANNKI